MYECLESATNIALHRLTLQQIVDYNIFVQEFEHNIGYGSQRDWSRLFKAIDSIIDNVSLRYYIDLYIWTNLENVTDPTVLDYIKQYFSDKRRDNDDYSGRVIHLHL